MVGAAAGCRAGLGSTATALVLALAVGTGCGGPAARHAAQRRDQGGLVDAARPTSAAVAFPRVPGLPWPVVLRTADGRYVIARSGTIRRLRPAPRRPGAWAGHPAGFVGVFGLSGAWAAMRGGHLVIARNRAVLWRSARRYAVRDATSMNMILAGRPGVVFQVGQDGPWFMAGWHGPEHRVAASGWPEMWTRSGNLIAVLHRPGSRSYGYAVFSSSGARLATLATGLSGSLVDQRNDDLATGAFWYLTGNGDLVRTDGTTTTVVANTRALGLTSVPEVLILRGGLIQLLSAKWRQGQVILYPDGRLFARVPPPTGQVGGYGALSASPGRRALAYIVTNPSSNAATIFVVRPGRVPVAVYRAARGGSPCAAPPLAWHGSWLLYTPHGGVAVVIGTAGAYQIIRLPSALPASTGRTTRVLAVSWR